MAVIGMDLGGTKLAGAVFDASGAVIAEDTTLLEHRTGSDVGTLVVAALNRLMAQVPDVQAIGIAVPGIANTKSGHVWAPNIPGWEDYPLREEVRAALSYEDVPVLIEADRACAIMGEAWHGAARGCRNAVFLTVGTGIGAGIMVDGRVLHGAHDIAGAIGWLALGEPWDEKYRACGHFEYYASGEGLARHARELLRARPAYAGALRDRVPDALTAHDVFRAYDSGDEIAMAVLARAIALWGMAAANLVSLVNPERIVFGGGVFGPATRFLADIGREARRWAQPIAVTRAEFVASSLEATAALHGAGYCALRATSPA